MDSEAATDSPRLFPPSFSSWEGTGTEREIAVLMSGGVDSSVTAMLLRDAGWKVLGITMKIPVAEQCNAKRSCCGSEAALVCNELEIPHYFVDVAELFQRQVIAPFERAYMAGRTPNPCIDCNTFVKFRIVWDFLEKTFGIEHLATGHYARVTSGNGGACLVRAADRSKDQSYSLYGIQRSRLANLVLPLGELHKDKVRELARQAGLPSAEREESMELCFAGESDYRQALPEEIRPSGGRILDMSGKVITRHDGMFNYTIGQRRHLGFAAGKPVYVVRICPRENSVTVGTREDASSRQVKAGEINILIPEELSPDKLLAGKIRSYGDPMPCTVREVNNGTVAVEFESPQFAPCPGQRLVLYDEKARVVAGGVIEL